eukprot:scaffold803_cov310-Pinguiococcus_pyrenoidosus.AAC.56
MPIIRVVSHQAGTPYCITVDFDTLEDGTVTIRDRDTCEQLRLHIKDVPEYVRKAVDGEVEEDEWWKASE